MSDGALSCAPSWGIYEKAFPVQDWPALFSSVSRLGFENLELSLDASALRLSRLDWNQTDCNVLRLCAENFGIRLFSACLSAHRSYPLGSENPETVQRGKDILRKAIVFCSRVGIRVLQVMCYDTICTPSTQATRQRYLDNLAQLCDTAARYGVMMAVEPLEHTCFPSAGAAMEIVDYCRSPWLQLYPDVANMAAVGIDPLPEIAQCVSHMTALHIREALPEVFHNVPFGSGIVPFSSLFSLLKRLGYAGPIHLEIWYEPAWNRKLDYLEQSFRFVKEAWTAASNVL